MDTKPRALGYRLKAAPRAFACCSIPIVVLRRTHGIIAFPASGNVILLTMCWHSLNHMLNHIAKLIPAGAFLTVTRLPDRHISFIAIGSAIRL